jgi:hydrogenase nickel incorporation protein HypB
VVEIPVVSKVLKLNDEIAAMNRQALLDAGVACVNLMGAPGCGKTALLEATLDALSGEMVVGVVAGDIATTRDAERLIDHTPHVTQINTGGSCHLEAHQVRQGMDNLPLADLDLLLIENVGNLICPVSFDLGEGARVGMFSVTEGHDKPAKHPSVILAADLVLLGKTDLLPYVPFEEDFFRADLGNMREDLPILPLSATTGEGMDAWISWVTDFVRGAGAR